MTFFRLLTLPIFQSTREKMSQNRDSSTHNVNTSTSAAAANYSQCSTAIVQDTTEQLARLGKEGRGQVHQDAVGGQEQIKQSTASAIRPPSTSSTAKGSLSLDSDNVAFGIVPVGSQKVAKVNDKTNHFSIFKDDSRGCSRYFVFKSLELPQRCIPSIRQNDILA